MRIKFVTYENIEPNSVDELELSTRAINSLKRAHIMTIGDLVNGITKLDNIKNCGIKTINEIKSALFNYELQNSPDVKDFMRKVEIIE